MASAYRDDLVDFSSTKSAPRHYSQADLMLDGHFK
jgi:hypothetical protein